MVDTEVAFPPAKEYLYVPSELVNKGNLICCQVMTTCGNPVFDVVDSVSHYSDGFLGSDSLQGYPREQSRRRICCCLDRCHWFSRVFFFVLALMRLTKCLQLFLPLIKSIMGLVSTIGDASLPRGKDHTDKRPLSAIAIGKEYLSWNTTV